MGVSRSGYYKWKNRDKSGRDINREAMIALDILFRTDTLFRCIYQTDSLLEAFESQRRTRAVSRWPFGCDRAVEWQQGADHYSY